MIAGVDGCRGGWYVVRTDESGGMVTGRVYSSFHTLFAEMPEKTIIAIDIPVGLMGTGPRLCDLAARRMLGRRATSVFPAPIRPVLDAPTHAAAAAIRQSVEGKRMSIQSFAITAKVREVDMALRSSNHVGRRVFEVHPELSFTAMNGNRPAAHSKKRAIGRSERLELLSPVFGGFPAELLASRPRKSVAADDVLDALAALWTAQRIASGASMSLPNVPPTDETGLPMGIFY